MEEEVEGEGKGKHKPEQPEQYLEEVFADGSEHGGVDCNAREVCGEEERVHPAEEDCKTGQLLQPDNPVNWMLVSRSRFVSWGTQGDEEKKICGNYQKNSQRVFSVL